MKVALTTAIYGGYDTPKPVPVNLDVDAFLFTDSEETFDKAASAGWIAILDEMEDVAPTPMLRAKWWKTHPFSAAPGYDASIWLDGSMTITVDNFVERCLAALGDDDIAMTPHPERYCIHTEAQVTASLERYNDCDPLAQVAFYESIGHPRNWGLMASGASTRRHGSLVKQWGEYWWDENVARTYQDQLSLPVITRIMQERGLRWNMNMPWWQWWAITPHGF